MNNKKNDTPPPAMNPNIVDNIKHVVVLMMENRSFDHIFGDFPGVNGIQNASYNLPNPTQDKSSGNQAQYPNAINVLTQPQFNPDHSFNGMMTELFGPGCIGYLSSPGAISRYNGDTPVPLTETCYPTQEMCGYYFTNHENAAMSYFEYLSAGEPGRLNVLHTLAENFVVCDHWFCDTPSETVPNRFFVHAATNMGYNDDNACPSSSVETDIWNALTVYEQLDNINPGQVNWAVYSWPTGNVDCDWFEYLNNNESQAKRDIANFTNDIANGNLPFYSFLIPSLNFPADGPNGNSMHPNGDVRLGENYIAQVYMALRNSAIWNNTLLIITYDENGGICDHVPPPVATPPDGITYPVGSNGQPVQNPFFDYSILGPRIPAILVSPWLANPNAENKQYQIDSTQYQNTSILRFVQDLLTAQMNNNTQIGTSSLTLRDQSANSFANSPFWLSSASDSCPAMIDIYTGTDINNYYIAPWGTCLTGEANCPLSSIMANKPTETALHFVDAYLKFYPGHPDSGKSLTRTFNTNLELIVYVQERKEATRNHALKGKSGKTN